MNLELEIGELELHGFPAFDKNRIALAVQGELERLFVEMGAPPSLESGVDMAHIDCGSFEAAPGSSPEAIGVQVARALYGGMTK